jgi:hypothetical protein
MATEALDTLIEASGLSPIFARATIMRTIERSGLDARKFRTADIPRLQRHLELALRMYLGEAEARLRLHVISQLVSSAA